MEKAIANSLKLSYESPGYFFTSSGRFENLLNYNSIKDYLPANLDIVYSYYTLDKSVEMMNLSPVPSVDLYKKITVTPKVKKDMKFSTICYPNFSNVLFDDESFVDPQIYCLIIFGLNKDDSKQVIQNEFTKNDYNILQDYTLDLGNNPNYETNLLIGDVDVSNYDSIYLNIDFFTKLASKTVGTDKISFNVKNVGKYTGLYISSCPGIYGKIQEIKDGFIQDFPLCNMYFKAENMNFVSSYQNLLTGCTAVETLNENTYNFAEGVCIKKFSCSGCLAPSMCSEQWNLKTGKEYISYTQEVALSNEKMSYDSCVGK